MPTILSPQHRKEFFERGFTRVEGLIPEHVVASMVSRIWEALEEQGMFAANPETWVEGGVRGIGHLNRGPEFRPFGNAQIHQVVTSLLESEEWTRPSSWGQILVTFPASEWNWNSLFQGQVDVTAITWHTDYPYNTPPDELSGVQTFGLLADLQSGGGATLVVERSHLLVREFVRSQPPDVLGKMKRARQALMNSHPWLRSVSEARSSKHPAQWLDSQHTVINDIPLKVSELTGSAGDVYFTHPWLLHAISPNCRATPRMMCTQRVRV